MITEAQDITVYPHRAEKVRLAHLYVPPRGCPGVGWREVFNPKELPEDACVLGDLNAHHDRWNDTGVGGARTTKHRDLRGAAVSQWVDERRHTVLNTGESTHISDSTPDLSIVPERFKGARWRKLPCAGSDHSPLLIELPMASDPVRQEGAGRLRYKFKEADWEKYQTEAERRLAGLEEPQAATRVGALNAKICAAIHAAAEAAVPKGGGAGSRGPDKHDKSWWSKEIAAMVKERQQARKQAEKSAEREDKKRWNFLRQQTDRVIKKAKQAAWEDFASGLTLSGDSDGSRVFEVIKSLDGRKPTTRRMAVLHDGDRIVTDSRDKARMLVKRYAEVSRLETTDR
eukprot:gene19657-biopygen15063